MIPASVNEGLRKYRTRYYIGHELALVDGIKYEQHTGQQFVSKDEMTVSLFAGTEDKALAHAGPWLVIRRGRVTVSPIWANSSRPALV